MVREISASAVAQLRMACLSIAGKEAGRRGAKGDVEKRADQLFQWVLGRWEEGCTAAEKARVYEPPGVTIDVAGVSQAVQQPTVSASEPQGPQVGFGRAGVPDIEIRQMPGGEFSAWWKGEFLPLGRVRIVHTDDRGPRLVGVTDEPLLRYGQPVSLEEVGRVPPETRNRFPGMFAFV
ncbi:hypothetical protein [Lichenifustis flavocetrariae]|uniref:Uncharacterized protein n=1 Tax=Lichenifustis flavocetrariae TaxID=2949735 RepID=A0AA41Z472_9HYPH|nr:hypothetical protein [Lichenifustis flavocetrariae]MCW6512628.1 hypothetical protein [Lichenifustis flavocetrariae]